MATLTFKSNANLRKLARETLKAKRFNSGWDYDTDAPKTTTDSGLRLVHDDGVYLCNAFTPANKKSPKASGFVVHAKGMNPATDPNGWDAACRAVGGDDFVEFVPFTAEQLQRISKGGVVKISISPTQLEVIA